MNKLDVLNRDAFIEQLLRLIDNISSTKASTCFAINGQWGCGKSFVLDMLEEQLSTIQSERTHANYIGLFDKDIFPFDDSVEECLQAIFKDVDIRMQEQLVKKVTIAHELLFTEKKDYSFMCMELLTAVMICVHKYQGLFDDTSFDGSSFDRVFISKRGDRSPAFSEFFKAKFELIDLRRSHSFPDESAKYVLPPKPTLYGALLFTWCWMHSKRSVIFQHTTGDIYTSISKNHEELIKFAEMINMMQ